MNLYLISRALPASMSALAALALLTGCGDSAPSGHPSSAHPHSHDDHAPPHGGTPVLIADDEYHLELVLDASSAKMQAYVLDGHLEDYVAVTETNFLIRAMIGNREEQLSFRRVADRASGKVADKSSVFEAQADGLKGVREFTGGIPSITLNGRTFTNLSFPFPKGSKHVH
jgi:predicted small lipoprotein YifL